MPKQKCAAGEKQRFSDSTGSTMQRVLAFTLCAAAAAGAPPRPPPLPAPALPPPAPDSLATPDAARDPVPVVSAGNRRNLPGNRYTQIRAWYMGMCGAIDDAVGEIVAELEALDQADNTLTLFTSDHGELMMAHGAMLKGVMYDEVWRDGGCVNRAEDPCFSEL